MHEHGHQMCAADHSFATLAADGLPVDLNADANFQLLVRETCFNKLRSGLVWLFVTVITNTCAFLITTSLCQKM